MSCFCYFLALRWVSRNTKDIKQTSSFYGLKLHVMSVMLQTSDSLDPCLLNLSASRYSHSVLFDKTPFNMGVNEGSNLARLCEQTMYTTIKTSDVTLHKFEYTDNQS